MRKVEREIIEELLRYLPDGPAYEHDWAWKELDSAEQDAVKQIRRRAAALLAPATRSDAKGKCCQTCRGWALFYTDPPVDREHTVKGSCHRKTVFFPGDDARSHPITRWDFCCELYEPLEESAP